MPALSIGDRVLVQSTTPGTGTYQLGAAVSGYQRLGAAGIPSGATVPYTVVDNPDAPTQWEVCEGVFTAGSPDTLTRGTVMQSSNGTSAINWGTGTRYIFIGPSARRVAILDTAGKLAPTTLPPGAASILRSGTTVAVPNATPTTLTWNVNATNTLGGIDPGLSTWSSIVIATGGLHTIKAAANFAANSNGIRELRILVNGAIFAIDRRLALGAGDIVCSASVDLVVGDNSNVLVQIYQDCGGPLYVGGTTWSQFSVARQVG